MNLFVVPSWYPHRCYPLEGIFLMDQAVAVGDLHPDWSVAVSLWGQGTGRLSLAHLRHSPHCLWDALSSRPRESELRPNVREFLTPALSWTERWRGGNRDAILAANLRNLRRATQRFGPVDLIHAHVSYPGGWVAMELQRRTGIPYVVTEHMGPFPLPVYERPGESLWSHIRLPLERAGERIAVSPALCERIAGFGIAKPKYVPNVVDERTYAPTPTPQCPVFGFFTLCQMEAIKGIPDLLRSIRAVVDEMTEAERAGVAWRLGGSGSQGSAFRRLSTELGLDRWVTWLGFVPRERAREEFRACRCLVLASHHESFGMVLVEAAAFGKPVIATRSGGPETTVTETSGVLVAPGRPEELAQAMLEIFRGRRVFDAGAIRAQFLSRYSRAAVVGQLEAIYDDVLARAR